MRNTTHNKRIQGNWSDLNSLVYVFLLSFYYNKHTNRSPLCSRAINTPIMTRYFPMTETKYYNMLKTLSQILSLGPLIGKGGH